MGERTWTVAEIGARIDQVVGERMAAAFWVGGEIADHRTTARGMVFFSLVQTDDRGRVIARLPGTISAGKARLAERRMLRVGQPLQEGLQVRIRGHLEYYAAGGRLSLALDDIDPAHTAGAMAMARRALLQALEDEGLLRTNASRPLARLPLRVGLITRGGSQAYHDLTDELEGAGLPFEVTLISSGVQGVRAPGELTAALSVLGGRDDLDLILLTRGGGAEVELATFDDPGLARAVAACRLQVWTGIGHHTDTPVCEQVAARAFKTPTALAQGLVQAVRDAVDSTERRWDGVTRATRHHLARAGGRLDLAAHRVRQASTGALLQSSRRLDVAEGLIDAHDPDRLLARGWSITRTEDGALATADLPAGSLLRTTTRSGTITSEVVPPVAAGPVAE